MLLPQDRSAPWRIGSPRLKAKARYANIVLTRRGCPYKRNNVGQSESTKPHHLHRGDLWRRLRSARRKIVPRSIMPD